MSQDRKSDEVVSLTLCVEGKTFIAATPQDEPRIRDLEYAAWLGFRNPIDIRKLIKRLNRDGLLNDSEVLATVAKTSSAGGRPGTEYWLTRAGAVKVAAKSETPRAIAILDEVVRVWDEVRRRMVPLPTAAAAPSVEADHRRSMEAEKLAQQGQRLQLRQWETEQRFALRCHEVDLRDRKFKVAEIHRLKAHLVKSKTAMGDVLTALAIKATELATGETFAAHLPEPPQAGPPPLPAAQPTAPPKIRTAWWTPTEIAAELEVTIQKVARAISDCDLRGKQGLCQEYAGTIPGTMQPITLYRYAPAAVQLIARRICDRTLTESPATAGNDAQLDLLSHAAARTDPQPPTSPAAPEIIDRRTNADKRQSVEAALRDPVEVKLSNREIARRCGVTEELVRDLRGEIYPAPRPVEIGPADGRTVATESKKASAATGNQNARKKASEPN